MKVKWIGSSTEEPTTTTTTTARKIGTLLLLVLLQLPALGLGAPDASPSPDITTPRGLTERGTKKFSDECKEDRECGFDGSYCDLRIRQCICRDEFPATNHIDKCGHAANINESCFFTEQCETTTPQTECRDGRCICIFEKVPVQNRDGSYQCVAEVKEPPDLRYVDPAMIGILAGMALMFVIICVVLRLFSKARWSDNRTIFNTPNTRLMNVSLLRDNKLLHGHDRRGSRASVRAPSRQPSMASLRAHSPNASQDEKILLSTDKGKQQRPGNAVAPAQQQITTETPLSPGSRTGSRRGSRGSSGNASTVAAQQSGKINGAGISSPPGNNNNNNHHHHHHHQQNGRHEESGSVTVEITGDKS